MAGCLSLRAQTALTVFLLALSTLGARSQEPPQPAPEPAAPQQNPPESATPFKLHVYANLVQVPTLVLSSREKLPPPIARENFTISLDSGRLFHPTQLRMAGNDPIALGILLDAGGDQSDLLAHMRDALAKFAQTQLHSGDRVTLYAVDCKVMRNLLDVPPEPALIKSGVEHLLSAPGLHGDKAKPACGATLHLWDAVVYAANAIGKLPGRRVLLVVSAGNDAKSKVGLQAASEFLTNHAIALFGIRDPDDLPVPMGFSAVPGRSFGSTQLHSVTSTASSTEDPFESLCAQNGGIVLRVRPRDLDNRLSEFAGFLRGRYILEFPRPDTGEPGLHLIHIEVAGKRNYVIRPTGVPITMPDASLLNDPNTLHSQPSPATFGPRKILPPPKGH